MKRAAMADAKVREAPSSEDVVASSRVSRGLIAVMRVTVALLWIQNLSWKQPPDFGNGSDPPRDLYQWTMFGVQNEVFAPWAWFVQKVVLPNFLLFAWLTFVVEACLGAFLLVGLATRFWAVIGVGQSVAIILSILRTPNEWFWAYFLMVAIHLGLFAVGAGRFYGVDGILRLLWSGRPGLVARLLKAAS